MRHDPHLLVEGCLIAGFAMGANVGYIYVRGEFIRERERVQAAIDEAYDAKLIGKNNVNGWDFDLYVHHGAGAYICGEETALLESLEGKKGQPRLKPPFPANVGLYGCPTTVQNVESIAVVPISAAWRILVRRHWPSQQHRNQAFCISGHVEKPCSWKGMGTSRTAETHAGGVRGLGQSACSHSRRIVDAAGARGHDRPTACGRILTDAATRNPRRHSRSDCDGQVGRYCPAMARISYFCKHESCGCTPCREGGLDGGCSPAWRKAARRSARSTC